MSRKERRSPGRDPFRALLEAGDHRAARVAARAVARDPVSPDDARAAAEATLASLAPDRGAALAGALGLAAALALTAFVLLPG